MPSLLPFLVLACTGRNLDETPIPEPLRDEERTTAAAYAASTVVVRGRVLDAEGAPVADALVALDEDALRTGPDGSFTFPDRPRRNAILRVDADGHHAHVQGVKLVVPQAQEEVLLPDVHLDDRDPARVRFLFGGDTALGRRYLDPEEDTPRDQLPPEDPAALIRRSTAADDSVSIVAGMMPFFEVADVRVLNLETPVTDNPATPHWTKAWAFFTLPESLAALDALGVGFVSLGNNHLYDYLEQGVVDTLRHLDAAGIARAGAGSTPEQAWAPHRFTAAGTPYTWVSATSIAGFDETPPLYTASATQGGAADLRDTEMYRSIVSTERDAGRVPIALLHMGNEYARGPTDYVIDRATVAIEEGAAVVIGHHPHTVQGFSRLNGGFVAWSLGNFAFDQDRVETMLGYTVMLDVRGAETERARLIPHFIDGYRPFPAVGALADRIVREAGERSTDELTVVADGGHGRIVPPGLPTVRTLDVEITVGEDGLGYVDLRDQIGAGESVIGLDAITGADRWWLGRDQLVFGDFEDDDVDDETLEASRWSSGDAGEVCLTGARTGTAGFCLYRTERSASSAALAFRHRVRVPGDAENTPNKDLTFFGWVRGDNAGVIDLYVRFYASFGETYFGKQDLAETWGTFGWRQVIAPIELPIDRPDALDPWSDNARAVRIFAAMDRPDRGEARVALDDLAIVAWEHGPYDGAGLADVRAPNSFAFVRVAGEAGAQASVRVTLAGER